MTPEEAEALRIAARAEADAAPPLTPALCDYLNAQFREEKALIVARIKETHSHGS